MLSESDLKLVDALQASPRVPWSALGRTLGIGAATAARHWDGLVERGEAWLTAYPGGELRARLTLALVEIDCGPGEPLRVARELAADPHVPTVEYVAGHCDLLAHVVAPTLREVSDYVIHRLSRLTGVVATRTVVSPRLFAEGSRWRVRAISPDQRRALAPAAATANGALRFTDLDRALLLALGEDARASAAALAQALGVGASTVRRRLDALLGRGAIHLRCEIARPLSPAPVTATLWLRVPPDKLEATARTLGRLPEIRMCAAISGAANLCAVVWLRSQHDTVELESGLAAKLPWLEIVDRAVTLRCVKLMGRLMDDTGRSAGRVPLDFWAGGAAGPPRGGPRGGRAGRGGVGVGCVP
ncbi:Lrp/AsnC family transcriptional regulator, partial [Amycolatopsis sp. NPDC059027]|uniref:Lrp/AsnC family transcriptional regulator n=1 Tax=Amycolatopsis sp. NPDC059027 TaxID=3346709 RepID=UPI00366ACEDC